MSKWCEHCRAHYPETHYDEAGNHRIGAEFGLFGALLGVAEAAEYALGYVTDEHSHDRLSEALRGLNDDESSTTP